MIPFWIFPGSWGLKGKTREIAKAEYELRGYDLERRLAEINAADDKELAKCLLVIDLKYNKLTQFEYDTKLNELSNDKTSLDFKRNQLEIERHHGRIDEYAFDKGVAELVEPEQARSLALLDVDLKHSRITDQEYERRKADVLEEPWIAMPKISWDPDNPTKTYFELDYNEYFVNFLRDNNYQGSDEDCVNRWLNDICFSVLDEMNQPEPELATTIRKIRLPDGKTEHS